MFGSVLHIRLLLFRGPSLTVFENGVSSKTYQYFHALILVRGFSIEDTGHAADAPVSSRNLLELERGYIDREFLELTFVGEELV